LIYAGTLIPLSRMTHDPTVARRLQVLSPRCFATERTAAALALLVNTGRGGCATEQNVADAQPGGVAAGRVMNQPGLRFYDCYFFHLWQTRRRSTTLNAARSRNEQKNAGGCCATRNAPQHTRQLREPDNRD